jgi:ankyrin repeat protein
MYDIFKLVENNQINEIIILLDNNPSLLDIYNDKNYTPFIVACQLGFTNIVKILVNYNVNVHSKDKYNCKGIHWSAGNGHLDCLRYQIEECNIDPSDVCKISLRTPAHYAARNGHLHILEYLLNYCKCDLNCLAKSNVSPFQLAVWQNHIKVVIFLCENEIIKANPKQVKLNIFLIYNLLFNYNFFFPNKIDKYV